MIKLISAAAFVFLTTGLANGALILTLTEVDSNETSFSLSGSLSLTGRTSVRSDTYVGDISIIGSTQVGIGFNGDPFTIYGWLPSDTINGSAALASGLFVGDTTSGDVSGFADNGILVPSGYVSGEALSAEATFATDLATISNSLSNAWESGSDPISGNPTRVFTFNPVNPVPEPSSLIFMIFGGLAGVARRKRR